MIKPVYCRNCGSQLPPGSAFCPTCGASLTVDVYTPTSSSKPDLALNETGRLPAGRMLHQRYRLLQTVGQGGMGAVYVAQDAQLGDRLVAVKEMSMSRLSPIELPQAVEQFKHEAHLLASLHHPNLPAIYDYFGEGERWYLVMQFIEGGTLQSSLDVAPSHRLPVNEVVRIGIELCEVLDYLHTHQPQVIFRDLKPLNIMLTSKRHVALIDFGIARHFKHEQTKDTTHYYSVGYAPPEQYGESQTGPRSDLYSLGATLHQMLSGHSPSSKPFQFPDLQLIDPTIPVQLAQLVTQMLEMNEQARPNSAVEVKARLETVSRPETSAETRTTEVAEKETVKAEQSLDKPEEPVTIEPEIVREEPFTIEEGVVRLDKPVEVEQGTLEPIDPLTRESALAVEEFEQRNRLFPRRGQTIAWVCALGLSVLLGLLIGLAILQDVNYPDEDHPGAFLLVASIGAAIIGLVAIFTKGRPQVDKVGGVLIAILGELALFGFTARIVADTPNAFVALIPLLNLLLLIVGVTLFSRRVSAGSGSFFGIVIFVLGLGTWGILIGLVNNPDNSDFSSLAFVGTFIWIPALVVGVYAIVVPLAKRGSLQASETKRVEQATK